MSRWLVVVTIVLAAQLGVPPPARAQGLTLERPVPGAVLRPFDPPDKAWGAGHRGVDLDASPGAVVRAAAAGRVSHVGTIAGTATITITHDEQTRLRTTYQPVVASVSPDDWVESGQVIGRLVGREPHPGLHWGLVRGEEYLDPLTWLLVPEVRLLPDGALPSPPPTLEVSVSPGLPWSSATARAAEGPITSPFGMRRHPLLGTWRLHDGVDIGAACGSPARTIAPGRVVLVERHVAYGIRVVVEHAGGLRTGYTHLARATVAPGQVLAAGQRVGDVGSTGWSTGCHLHFMAWQDGRIVDPTRWV